MKSKSSSFLLSAKILVLALGTFLCASRPLNAQGANQFAVPVGVETTEGDYWRLLYSGKVQEIITAAAIPAIPKPEVWLTDLNFRLNVTPSDAVGGGGRTRIFSSFEVALASGATAHAHNFYDPAPDRTVVYNSPITFNVPVPQGSGPAPFNVLVQFQQPFLYHRGSDLLVEVTSTPRNTTDGLFLDFFRGSGLVTVAASLPDVEPDSGGWAVSFGYVVPELSPMELGGALALVLACLWKKSVPCPS